MKTENITVEFDERLLAPSSGESVMPVYTTPLNEFRLKELCRAADIPCYLPLRKVWKVNSYLSHGKPYKCSRIVLRPMFPSYVFIKATAQQLSELRATRAVIRFLDTESQDRLLEDIRTVRAMESVGLEQEIEFNVGICEGDRFLIENGVWEGVTGWLKKKDRKFLWTVELEFINQLVSTTINPSEFKMSKCNS
ncbi:MAG: hypothetical protein IKP58_04315 [Victivallales bacterium]|nr:hypothetical protein [Victivallales bacterium]MBR6057377.1 hypothetical protein [Victivallales bacterium]